MCVCRRHHYTVIFIELRASTKAYCLISCTVTTAGGGGLEGGRAGGELCSIGVVTRHYRVLKSLFLGKNNYLKYFNRLQQGETCTVLGQFAFFSSYELTLITHFNIFTLAHLFKSTLTMSPSAVVSA